MTALMKRFADKYILYLSPIRAAREAGYKDPNKGRQLLMHPEVTAYIKKNSV